MCFSDGSLLEEGSMLRAAAGRSVLCVTLSWLSSLLSPLHYFYFILSSPLHLHLSPFLVSPVLFLLHYMFSFCYTTLATDGLICMPLCLFCPLSLFLNSLFLSFFMPFSIFWVNLLSSLDHYLLFIYCSSHSSFHFHSSLLPSLLHCHLSLSLKFSSLSLSLSLKQHWTLQSVRYWLWTHLRPVMHKTRLVREYIALWPTLFDKNVRLSLSLMSQ